MEIINLQSRRPDQSFQGPTTACALPHNAHAENAPQPIPQGHRLNGAFQQDSSLTPKMYENVKKGNEGMDFLRHVSPVVAWLLDVTSYLEISALWDPKCPSEHIFCQREAPFQAINPKHQKTLRCTSWLWQEHLLSHPMVWKVPIWKQP